MGTSKDKRILIVGGGIAGLAVARALILQGFKPTLIEKTATWSPIGAGLYIPHNGVDALDRLGLGEQARNKGAVIDHRHIYSGEGSLLMRLDLQDVWHQPKPCLGILRHDLHTILLDGLADADIRLGTTLNQLQQNDQTIAVTLSDGTEQNFDLMIAADGLHSSTREKLFGPVTCRQVSPLTCRFVSNRPAQFKESDWTLYAGNGTQFLCVPVNRSEAYFYVGRQPRKGETLNQDNFFCQFETAPEPIRALVSNLRHDQLHWSSLEELPLQETFGDRRVVVIGDAAHAMPPYMAQGASLGFEDALVLANLLARTDDWQDTAGTFTNLRKPRIEWTLSRNQRREKLTKLPYWAAKLGMRLVGKKAWAADYAPLAEPADGIAADQ